MTLAEDMSYNLGPMCSREQYDEFLLPYYKELVPLIQARGTKVLIDTDGNVEPLIPWFLDGGHRRASSLWSGWRGWMSTASGSNIPPCS